MKVKCVYPVCWVIIANKNRPPQWLSRWFLRFITTVPKNQRTDSTIQLRFSKRIEKFEYFTTLAISKTCPSNN
jgi:hypothetical protein